MPLADSRYSSALFRNPYFQIVAFQAQTDKEIFAIHILLASGTKRL